MISKRQTRKKSDKHGAVAVFDGSQVKGHVIATPCQSGKGIDLVATFTLLPSGKHGFHIHKAGDLREKDCMGLCEHYDKGKHLHGDGPAGKGKSKTQTKHQRHTGDLGNISLGKNKKKFRKTYCLESVSIQDLWGRSIIVHEDEDDLGKGGHDDSHTTGHSGSRMACSIFGRLCH